ncbi:MAG: restriction endonuclease subunit S [Chlorobiales bacterium]|nr:restriction endonuclease subunit S [Chlorobiales bacterium]
MKTTFEIQIPEGWESCDLHDFGVLIGGGTPSRSQMAYWKGSIPWASVKDFNDEQVFLYDTEEHISLEGLASSAANLVPENTPVICTRMAVGRCALTTRPTAINQDLKAFLLKKGLDRRFFIRLLRYNGPQLDKISVGSTVRGITIGDLLSHKVLRPQNNDEQTLIAYVLDSIDEAISKTEAVIAKLKQVRAGMLHDLLNYGLDEHGQLRDPIAHPEQFKVSPQGLIPKDWGFGPFSEIAIVNPPKPVIRISPVSTISFIPMQDIDEEGSWIYRQTKKLIDCGVGYTPFIDGDVLFAKITPCMENGKGCHARNLVNGYGLGSTEFHVLRSKTNSSDRFVFHWSMTKRMRTKALAYMTGSAGQQRVEAGFFSLFDIPIPPFGEQNLIANQLDETDKQIETSRKELSKIKAVRIGIQDDLLTGRVRVPETVSFQESKQ